MHAQKLYASTIIYHYTFRTRLVKIPTITVFDAVFIIHISKNCYHPLICNWKKMHSICPILFVLHICLSSNSFWNVPKYLFSFLSQTKSWVNFHTLVSGRAVYGRGGHGTPTLDFLKKNCMQILFWQDKSYSTTSNLGKRGWDSGVWTLTSCKEYRVLTTCLSLMMCHMWSGIPIPIKKKVE